MWISLCVCIRPPTVDETSENVLQGESQAAFFDERHDGQQQGHGNKCEDYVRQWVLLFSFKVDKQSGGQS
jgi:hypothetical protein